MALDRLKSVAQHVTGTTPPPHPFDPLSNAEIETAVSIVRSAHGKLFYNAVTLREPKKKEMLKWLENPSSTPKPTRVADVVALAPGGAVYDGLVDLRAGKIIKWEQLDGVQPLVSISAPMGKSSANGGRSQWRISRLWNTLFDKTPRSLSNAC
jgi:primary-amine oxidase